MAEDGTLSGPCNSIRQSVSEYDKNPLEIQATLEERDQARQRRFRWKNLSSVD